MANEQATIGRARTVLTFGQGDTVKAVVSTVVVALRRSTNHKRLVFVGPATFDSQVIDHLCEIVQPTVDRIVDRLCPGLKPMDFELSIVNLGAASVTDVGLDVSGFSADVAVFLALLSAALQIPLVQDIVATGHIASTDGDIRSVKSIPAKLSAAVEESTIRRFIYPSLDADTSMQTLAPSEKQQTTDAIIRARKQLRTISIADAHQLLQTALDDNAIIQGALGAGFFESDQPSEGHGSTIDNAVRFLCSGNEKRFWGVLEAHLLCGRDDQAKAILLARVLYHTGRNEYPKGFGRKLLQLVRSLPPATRRLKISFPLLAMDKCIELCRFAAQEDHEDAQHFLDAALGKARLEKKTPDAQLMPAVPTAREENAALEVVLAEIDAQVLAQKIGLPIDSARASYVMEGVTIESHEAFHDTISAFYLAVLRYTDSAPTLTADDAVAAEGYALLDRAFADKGGADAAQTEARYGTNGGMRLVLDVMTEQFKTEQQGKHVSRVFKEAIDSLDWDARVAFMTAFLERIGPQLPTEIRNEPPERFARHYETILQTYVRSLDRVKQLLRKL